MAHIPRRRMILVALVPLLLIGVAVTQSTRAADSDAQLQSIRSRLPFISTRDFLYRREPRDTTRDKELVAAAFRVLMELESSKLKVGDLVGLTSHAAPDIRALALLGLVREFADCLAIPETRLGFHCLRGLTRCQMDRL